MQRRAEWHSALFSCIGIFFAGYMRPRIYGNVTVSKCGSVLNPMYIQILKTEAGDISYVDFSSENVRTVYTTCSFQFQNAPWVYSGS